MQDFATKLYNTKAWQRCRDQYAKSKQGLCERCLSRGIYKPGEIVHHKVHLTPDNVDDTSVTLNPENLELLCREHHAEAHKGQKRYKVDDLGRIIITE